MMDPLFAGDRKPIAENSTVIGIDRWKIDFD
jgi:hypothetical protein